MRREERKKDKVNTRKHARNLLLYLQKARKQTPQQRTFNNVYMYNFGFGG